jgi:predicted lipoprotein with Yx(FWY)xxD motif
VGIIRLNRTSAAPIVALTALALSACGSSSSPSSAASSPSPAVSPAVVVATATVAGTSGQVLTTPAGLTLYYLTSDVAATPKCSAACLTHWPPLLSTGTPALPSGVSGTLTVVQNANGAQVAYNGHLLYEFANDKAQGDSKGEGINAFGGTWHVATPGLTPM